MPPGTVHCIFLCCFVKLFISTIISREVLRRKIFYLIELFNLYPDLSDPPSKANQLEMTEKINVKALNLLKK